jgi:thioredoxin 1
MAEIKTITDDTLDEVLNGDKPALVLFSDGEKDRGDFRTAFKNAAAEHDEIVFVQVNPKTAPAAAARFEVGTKPVMISWAGGEVLGRRSRPWGTDVPSALDVLKAYIAEQTPPPAAPDPTTTQEKQATQDEETSIVYSEPVNVTDDTFQAEVIDSDLPVLIDFWAEWCGPCRMVAPILEKLAKEFEGQVKIAKVDVDNNPQLSASFQIRSIPNMMAIKDKTIVFNQPGALPEPSLRDLIQQLIALEIPPQEEQEQQAEGND